MPFDSSRELRGGAIGSGSETPCSKPHLRAEQRSIVPAWFAGVARHPRGLTPQVIAHTHLPGCSSRYSTVSADKLSPRPPPSPPRRGTSHNSQREAGSSHGHHLQRDIIAQRHYSGSGSARHEARHRSPDRLRPRTVVDGQRDLRDGLPSRSRTPTWSAYGLSAPTAWTPKRRRTTPSSPPAGGMWARKEQ